MPQNTGDNKFGVAKWIVDPSLANGTHSTIASAISSAASGETIFIRPGTYTENLTLKAGVNICAFDCDSTTPNVTIIGTCTLSSAGTVSMSGIRLQTNSAAFLAVTGSAASIVNLNSCYLNATNATGISFTSANTSAIINIAYCTADLTTTGIAYFNQSSTGALIYKYCRFENTGVSTTASTISAGVVDCWYTRFGSPITSSGTAALQMRYSRIHCDNLNTTALTCGGSGSHVIVNGSLSSGSASTISVGVSLSISTSDIDSSNTNAITGAGSITYGNLTFTSTSSLINTTTKVGRNIDTGGISFDAGVNTLSNYEAGSFTPTVTASGTPPTVTYSVQIGRYTRVGNRCFIQGTVTLASASGGTGTVRIGGLPFTSEATTNNNSYLTLNVANITYGALVTYYNGMVNSAVNFITLSGNTPAAVVNLATTGLSSTSSFGFSGHYQI